MNILITNMEQAEEAWIKYKFYDVLLTHFETLLKNGKNILFNTLNFEFKCQ